MTINDLAFDEGATVYYDDGFRNVIEDHMTILRARSDSMTKMVEPGRAYKYEADYYGLLQFLEVPTALHWVTLRMNGYTSPMQYDGVGVTVLVPNPDVIEQMRSSHMSTRVIAS
ncbi:hypothetical protein D3C71_79160 [compost metagenome]